MIAGAAFVRFLLSGSGAIILLLALAVWALARTHDRRPRLIAVVLATSYLVASLSPMSQLGVRWLAAPFHPLTRADVPSGRTAVVVLGSGAITTVDWTGGLYSLPDPIGAERALEAARVYKLLDADWMISSGGEPDPDDPDLPSGGILRSAMMSLGVPAEKILVEEQSRTTRDEAVIVAELLKPLAVDNVVLVTSGEHMRRSIRVFRSAGVQAIPAIAHRAPHQPPGWTRWLPSAAGLQQFELVVHEVLGLAYYRLRGWQA